MLLLWYIAFIMVYSWTMPVHVFIAAAVCAPIEHSAKTKAPAVAAAANKSYIDSCANGSTDSYI
jgi:hypothetical protein